jgi:hypothetical protein
VDAIDGAMTTPGEFSLSNGRGRARVFGYKLFRGGVGGSDPQDWFLRRSIIPEPSTWAMMLLGFAGLGFVGYRQTRKGRAAIA